MPSGIALVSGLRCRQASTSPTGYPPSRPCDRMALPSPHASGHYHDSVAACVSFLPLPWDIITCYPCFYEQAGHRPSPRPALPREVVSLSAPARLPTASRPPPTVATRPDRLGRAALTGPLRGQQEGSR